MIGRYDQLAVQEEKGSYQKDTFLASVPTAFSTGECVKQGQVMGVCERTVYRWLDKWKETGIVEQMEHGGYRKVA